MESYGEYQRKMDRDWRVIKALLCTMFICQLALGVFRVLDCLSRH